MNPAEQRAHTKVTDELAERLANAEMVLDAVDQRLSAIAAAAQADIAKAEARAEAKARELVGQERTHRLQLAEQQRGYVDQQNGDLGRRLTFLNAGLQEVRERGFWRRLRRLIQG